MDDGDDGRFCAEEVMANADADDDDDEAEGCGGSRTDGEEVAAAVVSSKNHAVNAKIARFSYQVEAMSLAGTTALQDLRDGFNRKLIRIVEEQDKKWKDALLQEAPDQILTASLVAEGASGSRIDLGQIWGKIGPLTEEVNKTVEIELNKLGAELKKELDENCQRLTNKWKDEAPDQRIDQMGDKEEVAELKQARKRRRRGF